MKKILFFAISFALSTQTAYSETGSNSNIDCSIQVDSQGIYECAKKKAKIADKILNEEYRNLKRRISSNYRGEPKLKKDTLKTLANSQNTWIKLRDSNCSLESIEIEKGTQAFETTNNNCIADESQKRTLYLKKLQPVLQ